MVVEGVHQLCLENLHILLENAIIVQDKKTIKRFQDKHRLLG